MKNVWAKLISFAMLAGLVSCHSPQNSPKIGGNSDPIEGRFAVIGLAITDKPGTLHTTADGRTYNFSLVEAQNLDGSKKYYVTNDKNGQWNASSVIVAEPNRSLSVSITFQGTPRNLSVLTTPGAGLPFEAADLPLRGTGSFVAKVIKPEGTNGAGSILMKTPVGGEFALEYGNLSSSFLLVNILRGAGGLEMQSPIRSATPIQIWGGKTVFLQDAIVEQQFMELTNATTGAYGVWNTSGPSDGETGRLYDAL